MSTELAAIEGNTEIEGTAAHGRAKHNPARLSVIQFYGGVFRGKCLQLSTRSIDAVTHIQLTKTNVLQLKAAIERYLES